MSNLSCFMLCLVLLAGVSDGKKSSWLMALLSKSSNENVSNDLKHSSNAFSVLTNQVYQDDNDKENMSFYQKLIGGSKVDKYQEGSGIINHLVDAKNMVADAIAIEANAIIQAITDSEGMEMIKCVMNTVLETILRGILEGLLPSVERVRLAADGDKRTYLDMSLVGAMMGRLRCNHLVACRMAKWLQGRLSSAQLIVMVMEPLIPNYLLDYFGVVKSSVIDRSDNCEANYECSLYDTFERYD